MIKGLVERNDWLKLASGAVVAVCRVEVVDGTQQVSLRYVDDDGVMTTSDFFMTLAHLQRHATKVEVAPFVIGKTEKRLPRRENAEVAA